MSNSYLNIFCKYQKLVMTTKYCNINPISLTNSILLQLPQTAWPVAAADTSQQSWGIQMQSNNEYQGCSHGGGRYLIIVTCRVHGSSKNWFVKHHRKQTISPTHCLNIFRKSQKVSWNSMLINLDWKYMDQLAQAYLNLCQSNKRVGGLGHQQWAQKQSKLHFNIHYGY